MSGTPFTREETATILAALRWWQGSLHERTFTPEHDIATDGGELKPLTNTEIDALCEKVNFL